MSKKYYSCFYSQLSDIATDTSWSAATISFSNWCLSFPCPGVLLKLWYHTEGTQNQSALLKAMGEGIITARTSPFPPLFPLSKPAKPLSAAAAQECVCCSAKLFLWAVMLCRGEAATSKCQLWPLNLGSSFLQAKISWWGKHGVI